MTDEAIVPRTLQIAWFAFMAIWVPAYWLSYGPSNFLWFCDGANFVLTVAMLWRSGLLFSSQAVGIFIIQLVWCVDFFARLLFSVHPIGGTEYMFDGTLHPALRTLSLFHLAVPILLVWALRRFGYDRRAWKVEAPILWVCLVPSFFFSAELNFNWVWKPFGFEVPLAPAIWVPIVLVLYPAVILGISHTALRFAFPPPQAEA